MNTEIPSPQPAQRCQHKRYSLDKHEQVGTCLDCGAEGRMVFVVPASDPAPVSDGGPAFPLDELNQQTGHVHAQHLGMSLRDYFAAKAMAALILHANDAQGVKHTPIAAYAVADAMLKARQA